MIGCGSQHFVIACHLSSWLPLMRPQPIRPAGSQADSMRQQIKIVELGQCSTRGPRLLQRTKLDEWMNPESHGAARYARVTGAQAPRSHRGGLALTADGYSKACSLTKTYKTLTNSMKMLLDPNTIRSALQTIRKVSRACYLANSLLFGCNFYIKRKGTALRLSISNHLTVMIACLRLKLLTAVCAFATQINSAFVTADLDSRAGCCTNQGHELPMSTGCI